MIYQYISSKLLNNFKGALTVKHSEFWSKRTSANFIKTCLTAYHMQINLDIQKVSSLKALATLQFFKNFRQNNRRSITQFVTPQFVLSATYTSSKQTRYRWLHFRSKLDFDDIWHFSILNCNLVLLATLKYPNNN